MNRRKLGSGLLALLLSFGCFFLMFNIMVVHDPVDNYEQYVYAERDGYTKIEFMYSVSIMGNENEITINQDDIEQYIELSFWNVPVDGFYYRYFVVFDNGSIFETLQKYMPYAENRTLIDFDDVYLSINQNFSGIVESAEQIEFEQVPLFMLGVTVMGLVVCATWYVIDAFCD